MIPEPRPASAEEIPVIDLSRADTPDGVEQAGAELRKAALSLGFFYVTGHGVPQALFEGVFKAMRSYFALPHAVKMKDVVDSRFRRGFMPIGSTQHAGRQPDSKESYEVGLDLPLSDPDVIAGRFLHGPNRWPSDDPSLRLVMEPYFDAVMALGYRLMRVFAASLDLPHDYFVGLCSKPTMNLRAFHYPPQPADSGNDQFGAAPHCDYGMFTVLNQDPIGGLEVCTRTGEWLAAPFIDDTFVVNIGDLLKMWTNDLYVSTPHRVVNRTGRERYSVPVFFCPNYATVVECIPSCLEPGASPKYPPIAAGAYVEGRLLKAYRPEAAA